MAFFTDGVETLKSVITLLGAALGIWGLIQLLEGYSSNNPENKSTGLKLFVAGLGIAAVGQALIPKLLEIM
jgi:hypothetical protein